MTYTVSPGLTTKITSRLIAFALVVAFALAANQPAQAQNSDTWKSVAIIGGSTAAGAFIGHKIGGSKGALIGAGVGATAGYAIDRRRRQNRSYEDYGYYDPNSGYYGNDPYYGNDGYYGNDPYYGNGNSYASRGQYRSNSYSGNTSRQYYSRRRGR